MNWRRDFSGTAQFVMILAVTVLAVGCPDGGTDGDTVYESGDTGPAGGIVFYDKGSYSDGWRYMEAAPASYDDYANWGGYGTLIGPAAQGTAVGTGRANTQAIVAAYGNVEPYQGFTDYAAKRCADFEYGGYDDWFLPSKDELYQMYLNLDNLVGQGPQGPIYYTYCSSSEYDRWYAWELYSLDGDQWVYEKRFGGRIARAVRVF